MKKISIVTGSRAEFGLLYPLIVELNKSRFFDVKVVVTGSHLDDKYGQTIKEIKDSNIKVDTKIKVPINIKKNSDMAKVVSTTINKFVDYFEKEKPDLLVILGDRYEIFGVAIAASLSNIPIAHIAGGETTEGAVDEFLRHSITKMSYYHFATNDVYRNRIIQLGENPKRVFNVGSLSVDNIKKEKLISLKDLEKELKIDLINKKYAIVTYHPETIDNDKKSIRELIKALNDNNNINYIITKSNADAGGVQINEIWDKEKIKHKNWVVCDSLGFKKYLSLLEHSSMMIGNSSSGMTEAPSLKIPTINIGNRQKGRFELESIVNCKCDSKEISKAIKKASSQKFVDRIRLMETPYGDGNSAKKIKKILEKKLIKEEIDLKKPFYDLVEY